jgi:hypothetical protein
VNVWKELFKHIDFEEVVSLEGMMESAFCDCDDLNWEEYKNHTETK